MLFSDETGRLQVRQIPATVWSAFRAIAAANGRAIEAEGRAAIEGWVKQNGPGALGNPATSPMVQRLNQALADYNLAFRKSVQPSELAEAIGMPVASALEGWFTGRLEPTFEQLRAVAALLYVRFEWLAHGSGTQYEVQRLRPFTDPVHLADALITWNSTETSANPQGEAVKALRFVRSDSKAGELLVVQEGPTLGLRRPVRILNTGMHVSKQIGAGGEADLRVLFGALEILFKRSTRSGAALDVMAYILKAKRFSSLASGQEHPLSVLSAESRSPWWEDAWDPTMWRRSGDHWPEAVGLFSSIREGQQDSPYLRGVMEKWRKRVSSDSDCAQRDQVAFYEVEH